MSTRIVVLEAFGPHADAWDAIVRAAEEPNVFLMSSWLSAATEPRRARIVAVFDDDRLLGGIALEREHRAGIVRYRSLGYRLSPDHVDLVAAAGETMVVVDALRTWFLRPGRRVIELVSIDPDARVLGALPPLAVVEPSGINRIITLPESLADYVASRSRSFRSSASRAKVRLAEAGVEFGIVSVDALDDGIADLLALHAELFGADSRLLPEAEAFTRALRAAGTRGDVTLFEARRDGVRIAVDAWGTVGSTWSVLQGGRRDDPALRDLGRSLFLYGVETAIERGAVRVDLLRGSDGWKEAVSTSTRELVAARASSGRAAQFGHRVVGRVEYEIWRRRHANRHHDRTSRPTGTEA